MAQTFFGSVCVIFELFFPSYIQTCAFIVEMTDTFCSFTEKCHFCHLLPFAKVGRIHELSKNTLPLIRCSCSINNYHITIMFKL